MRRERGLVIKHASAAAHQALPIRVPVSVFRPGPAMAQQPRMGSAALMARRRAACYTHSSAHADSTQQDWHGHRQLVAGGNGGY